MCSQKLSRKWTRRVWLAGAMAAFLFAPGCAPDYVTENSSPVIVRVTAVSPNVLESDVRSGSKAAATGEGGLFTCPDFATVGVAVRAKNPTLNIANKVAMGVFFESYSVRFFRTDGRGVEGVDVPYRITGNMTRVVDVETSGSTGIPIEVVRHQAKNEPPLSTIFQTSVLTMMAEITLYGRTTAGEKVSGSGMMQIDFADYGDDLTACETIDTGE